MQQVTINEVGLRDGLQMHRSIVPVEDKLRLAQAFVDAGLRAVEATSFVSPKAVPQMADAAELVAGLPDVESVDYSVLVPNQKGLTRALAAGARAVNLVLSATDTMNEKNIGLSLSETRATCVATIQEARANGVEANAYIAVAFDCPYEGRVEPPVVAELTNEMVEAGAGRVIIADTIGAADPVKVRSLFEILLRRHSPDIFACHYHDTRAFALCNVWESLQAGVMRFDSSVGGLGGCPFSPGASGNLATEDLVLFLHQCGYETGVSLDGVLECVKLAREVSGRELGGRSMAYLTAKRERENGQH
ncbi:hydroxymethylglutaryl-CoA lyase [Natronocella acetinitrilica]|uniref:Hydroxymethylglutaryl-CoA lyase n=1 Tax=Natronocella acetinitrilica TaxID=414046 RepID=A0AAE3G6Z4_9GAMM|nr:hydroxymethylglutaryl-CoA lyase [Natronocella acetinitrilica]MCP1676981.1 hydroxymethylglutaryl-CoA lyase [Natronocella acetinitrilica]